MTANVQQIVLALQAALGVNIATGQIVLNINEGRLQSLETKSYRRFVTTKPIDTEHEKSA